MFLVEQGIPEAKIETRAFGKEQNLSVDQVKQQVEQDASLSPEDRQKTLQKIQTIVFAYNRRVDIALKPPDKSRLASIHSSRRISPR